MATIPRRAATGTAFRPLEGLDVLLVEDHADTLMTYAEGLRACGAGVRTARSAQMALLELERQPPSVLVIDIALPDADGNALLRKIRSMQPQAGWDIPAIALTAYNTPQDRLKTVASGFRAHVGKPVDPRDLALIITQVVHRAE